jgi:hypothetical protein
MPHDVQPFVNAFVEKVSIYGIKDIWETVCRGLIEYPNTVSTNTIIAAYRCGIQFLAREVGMHRAERPLGYHFPNCGKPGCPSKERPGHIIGELSDGRAKIRCKACGWKSRNVKVGDMLYFKQVHKVKAPLLFYHDFPSPSGLLTTFS